MILLLACAETPKSPSDASTCTGPTDSEGRLLVAEAPVTASGLCDDGCPRALSGDLVITGSDEEGDLELACVEAVDGQLLLRESRLRSLALPALREVGGLELRDNDLLESVSLPEVYETGDVEVHDNPRLALLSAPGLHQAASVEIVADAVELDHLFWVDEDLSLEGPAAIELPNVAGVEGRLDPGGASLRLPGLQWVGSLALRGSEEVELPLLAEAEELELGVAVELPALRRVGELTLSAPARLLALEELGELWVEDSELEALPALPLVVVASAVSIRDNPRLADLSGLGALERVDRLQVADNPLLVSLGMPALVDVHTLDVHGNASLTELGLGTLQVASSIRLSELPLASIEALAELPRLEHLELGDLDLTDLGGLASLVRADELLLHDLPALVAFGLPLEEVGRLQIRRTGIVGLDLPLSRVDILSLVENSALLDLRGLPAGVVGGKVELRANGLTSTAGLGAFTTLEELVLADHAALESLDAGPALTRLDRLVLDGNALRSLAGLSGLAEVGELVLRGNALASLEGLEGLRSLGSLTLQNNDALIDLDALAGVGGVDGAVSIDANRRLADLAGFGPAWIGGDLAVLNNLDLPTSAAHDLVDRVGLADIGGDVSVSGNGD